MNRPFTALAVLLSLSLGEARQQQLDCGSHGDKWKEELQLHRVAKKRGVKRLRRANAALAVGEREIGGMSVQPDAGDIAILDDSDGVVSRRNTFNLDGKTLRFLPVSNKYRYELADGDYDAAAASSGSSLSGLGDDDSRDKALPFPFPFFGANYRSVFINSDGNLTFGTGDVGITDRSLGRMTAGAPRISPLFADLDPSQGGSSVRVLAEAGRFVVSWVQVPEFSDAGTGRPQTFQARLYPDGKIEFAYSGTMAKDTIVGIGPGGLQGSSSLVSFATPSPQLYSSTVAERFAGQEEVDIFTAAQKFYLTHEDSYDYLVIYNALGVSAASGAVAFESTLRNNRSGYGDEKVDVGNEAGSKRRLQAILNMGPLDQYPRDPNAPVPARITTKDTSLSVLGHEAGHLFLAYVSVRDPDNPDARPMLGRQGSHWAFNFNSEASLLEGNRIRDNGPGASPRFTTVATVEGYAPLDQYLMGFRPPEEVPDTFLVMNPSLGNAARAPQAGVSFNGERRDIRLQEIIDLEHPRIPDSTVSQRGFRMAFLLVTPNGKGATADQLQQMETLRSQFQDYYRRASSDRATAETTLKRAIQISTFPAAGVVTGATASATITLERPAVTPLVVLLSSRSGSLKVPPSITVPAGQTQAVFEFTGLQAGTDDLIARPSDDRYASVTSKIQIAAPQSVKLTLEGGDRQPVIAGTALAQAISFRVTDGNELPYPGVSVQARVSDGGTVTPATGVTDENGVVQFRWAPGSGDVNELRATLAAGASAVATAVGRPSFSAAAVVNAASFASGITPGGIATIFGSNLSGTPGSKVEVLLNGRPAPIFYADSRQINLYVPEDVTGAAIDVTVRTSVASSQSLRVPATAVSPGIFFDAASGFGAILVNGTGQVAAVRPTSSGEFLEVYGTGLGRDAARVEAQIAGVSAPVLFGGLAPGFTGLNQVNVKVPGGVPSGMQSLVLIVNGLRSNEVKIRVR
ncbi:MAG TPA: hypothetical protein VMZ52_12240 [Bryobacteraceae bacterium]|nr:hypothetical protein [Bryobacteraceae bacterium]